MSRGYIRQLNIEAIRQGLGRDPAYHNYLEEDPRTKADAKKEKDKTIKFSKKIVLFCIFFICLYTVVQIILAIFFNIELTPILTTCVYTFFGTELAACMIIKIFDIKLEGSVHKNNTIKEINPYECDNINNNFSTFNPYNEQHNIGSRGVG